MDPILSFLNSKMMSLDSADRLLVIAPHPDDEVLGCDGLIQKVKKQAEKFIYF